MYKLSQNYLISQDPFGFIMSIEVSGANHYRFACEYEQLSSHLLGNVLGKYNDDVSFQ